MWHANLQITLSEIMHFSILCILFVIYFGTKKSSFFLLKTPDVYRFLSMTLSMRPSTVSGHSLSCTVFCWTKVLGCEYSYTQCSTLCNNFQTNAHLHKQLARLNLAVVMSKVDRQTVVSRKSMLTSMSSYLLPFQHKVTNFTIPGRKRCCQCRVEPASPRSIGCAPTDL